MNFRRIALGLVMITACFGILLTAAPAAAIGYYNLPGNFCQWCGYGNGAGYHSCLVLGPSTCQGACSPNEVRLACPPQPPCYGCGYYGSGYYAPPQYDGPAPRPAAAQYAPTPAAMRPQILR
jgi:hypothetical protein